MLSGNNKIIIREKWQERVGQGLIIIIIIILVLLSSKFVNSLRVCKHVIEGSKTCIPSMWNYYILLKHYIKLFKF